MLPASSSASASADASEKRARAAISSKKDSRSPATIASTKHAVSRMQKARLSPAGPRVEIKTNHRSPSGSRGAAVDRAMTALSRIPTAVRHDVLKSETKPRTPTTSSLRRTMSGATTAPGTTSTTLAISKSREYIEIRNRPDIDRQLEEIKQKGKELLRMRAEHEQRDRQERRLTPVRGVPQPRLPTPKQKVEATLKRERPTTPNVPPKVARVTTARPPSAEKVSSLRKPQQRRQLTSASSTGPASLPRADDQEEPTSSPKLTTQDESGDSLQNVIAMCDLAPEEIPLPASPPVVSTTPVRAMRRLSLRVADDVPREPPHPMPAPPPLPAPSPSIVSGRNFGRNICDSTGTTPTAAAKKAWRGGGSRVAAEDSRQRAQGNIRKRSPES